MELIKDLAMITAGVLCAIIVFVLFLFFLDELVSAMNNPTMCESLAKSFRELAQCP